MKQITKRWELDFDVFSEPETDSEIDEIEEEEEIKIPKRKEQPIESLPKRKKKKRKLRIPKKLIKPKPLIIKRPAAKRKRDPPCPPPGPPKQIQFEEPKASQIQSKK